MTKQDIVTEIEGSPLVQKIHQRDSAQISQEGEPLLMLYQFHCLIGDETTVNNEVVAFYVFDEGGPNEAAYYRPNALQNITPEGASFAEEIVAEAEAAKTANVVKAYKFTEIQEEYKWAKATAWQEVDGADVFREYLGYKNSAGVIQFDPISA